MYNPFNKNINELEYEDLEKLIENNISEGWHIEYKGSFPKNKKIANSIASFANSEGGWYIIGIEENDDENNPFEIVGFDLETNRKPDDKIANIIKGNIEPIPYFKNKIIETPENKSVLVVQVFEGHDTPYISNGSICIRVGETSMPLEIKDRYQFDKLMEKKEHFRKKIKSFMNNEFYISDGYTQPYLEFYIYVNNPKHYLFEDFYSEEFFEELKENFNSNVQLLNDLSLSTSLNFDNAYASVDSYILRHIYENNPLQTGLTLELFKEGHLKLILPFNVYDKNSLNEDYESLIYYDNYILEEYDNLRIIDLAESMLAFQTILCQYKRLLEKYNCDYELNIKYKFNNFDLTTPFIDSKEYMEFINENKLSINLKKSINIPNIGYLKCPFQDFNVMVFTIKIIPAMGLSTHLTEVISKGYGKFIEIKSRK